MFTFITTLFVSFCTFIAGFYAGKKHDSELLNFSALNQSDLKSITYADLAVFKGKNSLGYENGVAYKLVIAEFEDTPKVVIKRQDGTGYCPYTSYATFNDNWTVDDRTITKVKLFFKHPQA